MKESRDKHLEQPIGNHMRFFEYKNLWYFRDEHLESLSLRFSSIINITMVCIFEIFKSKRT